MMTRFVKLRVDDYRLPQDWTSRLLSPALVVYLDRVRENLRRTIALMGGDPDRWRPHIKTTKIPRVYAEMLRAGLRRFKCATLREAETLLGVFREEGIEHGDLLLAHPLVGPALRRWGALARDQDGVTLSVLCENPDAVGRIDPALGIFVDLNSGMHRTGIPLHRFDEIRSIVQHSGPRFRGVHFYDGHVHGATPESRREMAFRGYRALIETLEKLGSDAQACEIVTSGTPAFRYALEFEPFRALAATIHRVSPGTVVFHDLRTEQELDDLDLVPAAVVFSRIVSHPRSGRVTCDAGSKSIAAEAGDPCAFALGHPGLEALTPSEEHLPFAVKDGQTPERGTELYLVPRHICPTVNLAEQALLVDGEEIVVSDVRARAHDLLVDT